MSDAQLHIDIAFDRSALEAATPRTLFGAVRITAGRHVRSRERAPLRLVTCIDVSGSMAGPKLQRAKESLTKLVEQLSSNDELGIVAFESSVRRVFPQARMTPSNKEDALRAIERLRHAGSTNMSGGLVEGLRMLHVDPGSFSRVLLFTDGHANTGLNEGDLPAWEALLRENALGKSVSWFGYGEDLDGDFLAKLSDLSRGNYYRASNADAILDAFAQEIGGLLSVVAQDVRIAVRARDGFGPIEVLNDATIRREGETTIVELPDVYSEERRDVLFELPWAGQGEAGASRRAVDIEVSWTNAITSRRDSVSLSGELPLVPPGQEGHPNLDVLERAAILKAAQVQRRAAELSERGEFTAAWNVVLALVPWVKALGTDKALALVHILEGAAAEYGDEFSFNSSRSRLSSLRKGMGKMRTSGSVSDRLFETSAQKEAKRLFRGEDTNDE